MEATAKLRFARGSARKARLVLDLLDINRSLKLKIFCDSLRRAAAVPIGKLLDSAIANAKLQDPKLDLNKMVVSVATADEGPQMKRYMPRAMGRAYMIRKQTCHIALEIRTLED